MQRQTTMYKQLPPLSYSNEKEMEFHTALMKAATHYLTEKTTIALLIDDC